MDDRNHRDPGSHRWRDARRLALACALAGFWLVSFPVLGQETGVTIREASTTLVDGTWQVSARIDYRLSLEALDALQNGIPLSFDVEVQLRRVYGWWRPDSELAARRDDYQLTWEPLTRNYLLRNQRSDQVQSFTTLFAALRSLGAISGIPLIEASALEPGADYQVAMRVVLDQKQLPGPLRLLAFWSGGFTLESEWRVWRLES